MVRMKLMSRHRLEWAILIVRDPASSSILSNKNTPNNTIFYAKLWQSKCSFTCESRFTYYFFVFRILRGDPALVDVDPLLKTPFEWTLLTKMPKYLVPCAPRKQNLAEIILQSPFIKYTFHFNNRQQFRLFLTLQNSMPYKQKFIDWMSTARPSPHFLNIMEHPKQGTKFWQQIVYTWKSYLFPYQKRTQKSQRLEPKF